MAEFVDSKKMTRVAHDRFIIRDCLWIVTEPVGVPIYDFDFRRFFDCRTPYEAQFRLPGVRALARLTSTEDSLRTAPSLASISSIHRRITPDVRLFPGGIRSFPTILPAVGGIPRSPTFRRSRTTLSSRFSSKDPDRRASTMLPQASFEMSRNMKVPPRFSDPIRFSIGRTLYVENSFRFGQ